MWCDTLEQARPAAMILYRGAIHVDNGTPNSTNTSKRSTQEGENDTSNKK